MLLDLTLSTMTTPVAASVSGKYVEAVLPSKPYKMSVEALSLSIPGVRAEEIVFVAGDDAIGIVSITITNNNDFAKSLTVSEPPTGGVRGSGTPVSTATSSFVIRVAASSTVHLTFTVPLVFSPINGYTCLVYMSASSLLACRPC